MKILYLITKFSIGGTEAVVRDLALLASKHGHEVTIMTFSQRCNHIVDEIKRHNINMMAFPSSNLLAISNLVYFTRILKQHKYDIIHAHTEEVHFYLAFFSYFMRWSLPVVMTEHYFRYQNIRFNPFRRFMYRQYRRVICVSANMRDYFEKYLSVITDKCLVIHNGIHTMHHSPPYQPQTRRQQSVQVMCNARLVKQKDIETCIRAMTHTTADIQLVITGDGKLRKKLIKLITNLALQHKVNLYGWRDDVPALLQSSDIYIQTSRWEGFSIAILEAMAAGLPLIVSNAPGLVEAVGDAALIFPVGDAVALANCLDKLAANPDLRRRLAQRSLARVQEFSLDKMWGKYANVYQEVIQEHQ